MSVDKKYIGNVTVGKKSIGNVAIGEASWTRYWDKPKLVITFDEVNESQYTTAFPLFVSKGVPLVCYVIGNQVGNVGKLTWANLNEMNDAGMDIQCHSFTHANFTTLIQGQIETELEDNNDIFILNGLPSPLHHAYPLGAYNEDVKTWISGLRKTGRGVDSIYYPLGGESDKLSLNAISIDNLSNDGLVTVKGYMDQAVAANGALILYAHGMSVAGGVWEVPTQKCSDIIDYALANGFEVIGMLDLYQMMKETTTEQETVDLSVSSTGAGTGVATFRLYAKEDTVLTLSGNAKFYTDAAGTLGETQRFWLQRGGDGSGSRTIYMRCPSGTSVLTLAKDFIVKIVSWISAANAPSLGGDIGQLTELTNLSIAGNSTVYGDISSLSQLTFFSVGGSNTISGDMSTLSLLEYASCSSTFMSCSTVIGITGLSYINNAFLISSANVNQILADFWANRNEAKPRADRNINVRGAIGSGAPTGQGIIDKAALQAYKSPTPPGTAAFWTVTTR